MAKPTKSERRALEALDDAAHAAKTARKVAADLPDGSARPLMDAARDAKDVAGTSKKSARKHPKKTRKRAVKATDRVLRATEEALAATEQKVHEDAAQEPAEPGLTSPDSAALLDELSLLTVAELRTRARSQGRIGYSRLNKAALVELLS